MIGVPSKGRAGKSATLAALRNRSDVVLAVPPEEASAYLDAYAQAVVIHPVAPGIGHARQRLLEFAREQGTGPFWMLDDDITGAFERDEQTRLLRPTSINEIIGSMEWQMAALASEISGLALAGPNFRHRAWSGPEMEWNKHLRNFVWVNPDAPIDYWPHLKEDLDVVLQALTKGWSTLLWNAYAFDSPQMGTSAGGCRDDYDAGKLDVACQALVEKWPGLVDLRLDGKTGRLTNRVNWKAVREAPA